MTRRQCRPRRHPGALVLTRREFEGLGRGSHLSPRRGSSLEFSDFRHYALGDDFRFIDWGLYGRTDKLYIKLFKEEEDLLTYIFLDASASMGLCLLYTSPSPRDA